MNLILSGIVGGVYVDDWTVESAVKASNGDSDGDRSSDGKLWRPTSMA